MALLGSSWPILVKNCPQSLVQKGFQNWPKMGSYKALCCFQKNAKKKKWFTLASFLEHFWEQFWGPFWDQIGQRGGKMSPREPSGASKKQKTACSKTLKNLQFFSVFGCRGFPRELQEAREGSQETPKETPKGGPKLGQQLVKNCTQK